MTAKLSPNSESIDDSGPDAMATESTFEVGDVVGNHDTNPLAPIRKEPSRTRGGNRTGYGVEIYHDDQAEDTNNWQLAGSVSENYLLVPNTKVIKSAYRIAERSNYKFEPEKLFWDDKRMVFSMVDPDPVEENATERGDLISLGVLFRNSYNASMKYSATLFAERLVCGNGMVSNRVFPTYEFRHTIDEADNWQEEQEQVLSVLESGEPQLERLITGLDQLSQTGELSMADLQNIRTHAVPDMAVTHWGNIIDEFVGAEGSSDEGGEDLTAYGLLNAGTRTFWHRERTVSDYSNNQYFVDNLLDYAFNNLN